MRHYMMRGRTRNTGLEMMKTIATNEMARRQTAQKEEMQLQRENQMNQADVANRARAMRALYGSDVSGMQALEGARTGAEAGSIASLIAGKRKEDIAGETRQRDEYEDGVRLATSTGDTSGLDAYTARYGEPVDPRLYKVAKTIYEKTLSEAKRRGDKDTEAAMKLAPLSAEGRKLLGLPETNVVTGQPYTVAEGQALEKAQAKKEAAMKVAKARASTAKLGKVWQATYKTGLEEHGNQEKAIADADSAVAKLRKQSGKQTPSTKEKPSLDSFFK